MSKLWIDIIVLLIAWIITVIPYAKLFTKAGEPAWKGFIPIYKEYLLYKLTWRPGMFWLMLLINLIVGILDVYLGGSYTTAMLIVAVIFGVLALILHIIACHRIALSYSRKGGFTVGLIFLFFIFMYILAFTKKSEYIEEVAQEKRKK